MFTLPAPEVHARFAASGMSRYTYAEIVAAHDEFRALEDRYEALVVVVDSYIKSKYAYYPGWQHQLNETDGALWDLLDSARIPTASTSKSKSMERWPVQTWQKASASYRRLISRIVRQLAVSQKG